MIQTQLPISNVAKRPEISRLGNDLPTKRMTSVSASAGVFGIATCDSELPDVVLRSLLLHEGRNPSDPSVVNHINQS
jgi:hypothetical protein